MERLLGRLPRRHDKPTVHLSDYLATLSSTATPPSVAAPLVEGWGLLGNDTRGDCTCAAAGHLIMAWNADERRHRVPPSTEEVLRLYNEVTGGEDSGAMCIDVLDAWRSVGLGDDHVTSYVEVDPRRRDHVRLSIAQFGGLYCGVTLPSNAMDQVDAHEPWSLTDADALENPLGGHAIPLVGYDATGPICVTWGQLQPMTWQWFSACCDESFGVWDKADWMGDVPGLDADGLVAALRRLSDRR